MHFGASSKRFPGRWQPTPAMPPRGEVGSSSRESNGGGRRCPRAEGGRRLCLGCHPRPHYIPRPEAWERQGLGVEHWDGVAAPRGNTVGRTAPQTRGCAACYPVLSLAHGGQGERRLLRISDGELGGGLHMGGGAPFFSKLNPPPWPSSKFRAGLGMAKNWAKTLRHSLGGSTHAHPPILPHTEKHASRGGNQRNAERSNKTTTRKGKGGAARQCQNLPMSGMKAAKARHGRMEPQCHCGARCGVCTPETWPWVWREWSEKQPSDNSLTKVNVSGTDPHMERLPTTAKVIKRKHHWKLVLAPANALVI